MNLLKKLFGIGPDEDSVDPALATTETTRLIVEKLGSLEPDQARFVAAFAYVLGRVAHADADVSEDETRKMQQIVVRLGDLPEERARLVVEIAKNQTQLFGFREDFLVTREFARISSRAEREHLLDCLFAVSAADDSISNIEEALIRQISEELEFTHQDYIAARSAYNDKRDVLKNLPGMDEA